MVYAIIDRARVTREGEKRPSLLPPLVRACVLEISPFALEKNKRLLRRLVFVTM